MTTTETRVVRAVYTFFLGLMLALFVGTGISTVHPGPPEPEPPGALALVQERRALTAEELPAWQAYEEQRRAWEDRAAAHHRDVGIAATVAAVALLAAGLAVERRHRVLAEGVELGALFTLVYGILRSLAARDTLAGFVVVTAALAVVLLLGWRRHVVRPAPVARDG